MSRVYITAAQLVEAGACQEQIDLFRETFGERTIVTVAKARKFADKFDWDWARCLLDAPARAEYDRVRAAAWAEYKRVTAAAWAEYERVTAAAWAEYDRVTAPARAEYDRVMAPARAEYKRVTAPAWATAYIATVRRAEGGAA